MTNPLNQYFRVPKIYTSLPSGGAFYPNNFLEAAPNGELAVYALSALDQILLKTPDALLNGESLLKVVKNCVPGISDPKLLVEPDIKTLLLAIKVASTGPSSEYQVECPKCDTQHTFDVNLSNILDTLIETDTDPKIDFNGELIIHVRPYNFEQRNLQLLNEIEENRALRIIDANNELDDTNKMTEVAKYVSKMADRTFSLVAKSITSITVAKTGESVTDPQYIAEFLKGITQAQASVIMEKIKELNESGLAAKSSFICSNCGNEWDQPLDFDPTTFFG